jgi:pimeloyl-ACP methyl ester carboxylesterase
MMRRERATVGHKQISYLISESAAADAPKQPLRTLVLLHAFPLNADMWIPQLSGPPPGWRLIAPDYRGFGQSWAADSGSVSMNDLAGDVIDLLDALHVHEAVIAGCSMGGYVAFELLSSAPNYATGLILIDTRAPADTDEGKAGRRKMLETVRYRGAVAIADEMTPKLLGETTRRERPDLVKEVHAAIAGATAEAIAMAVTAMMTRKDMMPLLTQLSLPSLVVAGSEDALIPFAASEQMHGAIKGARLAKIPAAGHLPNLEQPRAFDAEVLQFLQRL